MGQHYIGREVLTPVKEVVQTLGYLAEGDSEFYNREDFLAAVIREDTRKIAAFHPKIDPILTVSLEEVIKYGMKEHEIEFFQGIGGVTSERCYQTGPKSKRQILQIRTDVIAEYEPLLNDEAVIHTQREHEKLRAEIQEILESEIVQATSSNSE